MRRAARLALEAAALTALLAWMWEAGGRAAYRDALAAAVRPVFGALGLVGLEPREADRFVSYVPFLVLMAVTRGLALRRRAVGALIGCAAIFVSHVGLVLAAHLARARHGAGAGGFSVLFPATLLVDCLPLVLWALIAREPLARALRGLRGSADPGRVSAP